MGVDKDIMRPEREIKSTFSLCRNQARDSYIGGLQSCKMSGNPSTDMFKAPISEQNTATGTA